MSHPTPPHLSSRKAAVCTPGRGLWPRTQPCSLIVTFPVSTPVRSHNQHWYSPIAAWMDCDLKIHFPKVLAHTSQNLCASAPMLPAQLWWRHWIFNKEGLISNVSGLWKQKSALMYLQPSAIQSWTPVWFSRILTLRTYCFFSVPLWKAEITLLYSL